MPVECLEFPIRYTLAYLIVGEDGRFIVVDPGWDSGIGREHLQRGLDAAGLSENDLVGIVATHGHPDHLALAPAIAQRTGAWIGMHPEEVSHFQVHADVDEVIRTDRTVLAELGLPRADLDRQTIKHMEVVRYRPGRTADLPIGDGDRLPLVGRDIRAVWTPGHTQGHISLVDVDSQLLLTGDHVLPRITPNIGYLGSRGDPRDSVADYLSSLERLRSWNGYEVCPAHEYRFDNLSDRLDELRDHTIGRSEEVAAVLRAQPNASVWDVAQKLTWSRGWDSLDGQNRRAALGETNAHVRHVTARLKG